MDKPADEREEDKLRGALRDVKIIATGGMSQIFRAKQPALDRYIVVKKLKDELLGHSDIVERFRREAKALASVLHQNIAHVYDFVEEARESYILMEYIDGIDVSFAIEKVGHLSPAVAASVLLGVAKGVSYIHTHNLIHRDIKPSNIRLTTRGEVKLMDFGIVIDLGNDSLTRPGMMVGSPNYLSPEQVLGDPITPKADIFLLGICLYEMLTGVKPFQETNGETVFQRIRAAKYTPAKKMQPQIPAALDHIIRKCLKQSPDHRYRNVKELCAALESYLGPAASHTDDIILSYLDQEALLNPAVPYTMSLNPEMSFKVNIGWKVSAALFLVFASMFGIGFWSGSQSVLRSVPPVGASFQIPYTVTPMKRKPLR